MKTWIKRLLFVVPVFCCAFQCGKHRDNVFYVKNATEETVVIQSADGYYDPLHNPEANIFLAPGESTVIGYESDFDWAMSIYLINDYCVSLKTSDGKLLRFWTLENVPDNLAYALKGCYAYFFKDYGVRQLHGVEKEWFLKEGDERVEYTFEILPEDLIPLSEFITEQQ